MDPNIVLDAVSRIEQAGATGADLAALLELIHRETSELLEADCFAIGLYDPREEKLHFELRCDRGTRLPPALVCRAEGWGPADRIVGEGTPLLFDRPAGEDLLTAIFPSDQKPRSWLGVPLLVGERVTGVLLAQHYQRPFNPAAVSLLETIAGHAAVAIQNLLLRREHERRIRELSALSDIGHAILRATRLEDLLEVVYRETGRVMDTQNLYIALYHPEVEQITFDYFLQDGQRIEQAPIHLRDGGLTARIVTTREPLLLGQDVEREMAELGIQLVGRLSQSYLGVPMLAGDQVVGVLSVQEPTRPRGYDRRQLDLLSNIANLTAVAIQNIQLYQLAQQRASQTAALNEIARAVNANLELRAITQIVADEVARLAPYDRISLALPVERDPEHLRLWLLKGDQDSALGTGSILDKGNSAVGRAFTSGQPFAAPDLAVEQYAPGDKPLLEEGIRSYVCVPLLHGGQSVGTLNLGSREPHVYGAHNIPILQQIAEQLAVAIRNAQLFETLERRVAEMDTLIEIGRALSSVRELGELLEAIYQQAGRIFDTSNFYIATYEEGSDEWELALDLEHGQRLPPARHKVSAGLTGYILRTRQPLLFRFGHEIDGFRQANGIPSIGDPARSWMGVPLVAAGQLVGAMAIQSYDQENLYDEQDLRVFSMIAAQAAIAVESAQLFETLERRVTEMDTLIEIGRALSSVRELGELLEAIYQQAGRIFDTSNFYIATYEEGSDEWELALDLERGQRLPPARHEVSAGLTGHIIRNRVPLIFYSAHGIEEFLQESGATAIGDLAHSWMGVPLIAAGELVGVMGVQSYEEEGLYDEHDLAIFSTIGTQAAVALYNARLYGKARHRAEEMETLFSVSRILASSLEPEATWRAVFRAVYQVAPYDAIEACLYDPGRQIMRTVMAGTPEGTFAPEQEVYSIGEGFTGWIAQNRRPLLVADIHQEPGVQPTTASYGGVELRAYLGVPMILGDQLIGTLEVTRSEVGAFDAHHVDLLMSVAAQAASAIDRAHLFEQARVRAEELAVLNELGLALTARLSVQEVLEEAFRQASRLVDTTNFFIGLYDAEKNQVTFAFSVTQSRQDEQIRVIPADRGLTGYMIQNRTSVLLPDNVAEGYRERGLDLVGEVAQSWLGVPLMVGDRVLGAMAVQSFTTPRLYDEHDRDLLAAIANQVAIALDNAQLFEQTQRALEEVREASERQRHLLDMVRELSTPLVPITDDVLVLPLVGAVDSARAQQILDVLLRGAVEQRARVVIVDITGVPLVDTSVANHILQATQALRLVGAECILVGITPEVAETVVGLGVDLRQLVTRSDLQGGIEYALRLVKKRITGRRMEA